MCGTVFIFFVLFYVINAEITYLKSPIYYEKKFIDWMKRFSVAFHHTEEFFYRLSIFARNDDFITTQNAQNLSYSLDHNEFSHLTWEEFRMRYKGYVPNNGILKKSHPHLEDTTNDSISIPDAVDWVQRGAVTHVKNQGRCGSCWAFSTTGAVEGSLFVQTHQLYNMSEQQLVDCDHNGDMGCNGGLMDHAFQWLEQSKHGLCLEEDYQYEAAVGECRLCHAKAHVVDYYDVPSDDENELKKAVAKQPVSIAIEADQPEFQFYSRGVFTGKCGDKLDHGVLLVGYGIDEGKKFWKIKNSWGPSWGENGYIRVIRDAGIHSGQCGLASVPSYPKAQVIKDEEEVAKSTVLKKEMEKPKLVELSESTLQSTAEISQCGNKEKALVHFTKLDIHPTSPVRGEPVKFHGSGNLAHGFSNATFTLNVKLSGITVFKSSGNMCGETRIQIPLGLGHLDLHGFHCPTETKPFDNLGADVNLPFISPPGTYEIELDAQSGKDDLFCVHVALGLSKNSKVYEEIL